MLFRGQGCNASSFSGSPQTPCLPPLTCIGLWCNGVNWCVDGEGGRWCQRWCRGAPSCRAPAAPLKNPSLPESYPLQRGSDSTCEQEPCHSNRWAPVQTAKKTCIFIKKKKKGTEGMNTSQKHQHLSVSSLERTNPWLRGCVGAELNSLKKLKQSAWPRRKRFQGIRKWARCPEREEKWKRKVIFWNSWARKTHGVCLVIPTACDLSGCSVHSWGLGAGKMGRYSALSSGLFFPQFKLFLFQ